MLDPYINTTFCTFGFLLCILAQFFERFRLSFKQEAAFNKSISTWDMWKGVCLVCSISENMWTWTVFTLPDTLVQSLTYLGIGGFAWASLMKLQHLCQFKMPRKSRRVFLISETLLIGFFGLFIWESIYKG